MAALIWMTLDGVMEAPEQWQMDYWNDELWQLMSTQPFEADALLLGRVTYDSFAGAWPERGGDPFGDRFNSMPKFVVSRTLETADWTNTTVLGGDLVEEVTALKSLPGKELLVLGSGALVHALAEAGLVDEYRLWIYPLVRGTGTRLFREGFAESTLRLVDGRIHDNGVITLTYVPAGE